MAAKTIKARVLVTLEHNGIVYKPDTVIEVDPGLSKNLIGHIDVDPDAVKYCLDQGASVIKIA